MTCILCSNFVNCEFGVVLQKNEGKDLRTSLKNRTFVVESIFRTLNKGTFL